MSAIGEDYLVRLHLDLPPYNRMEKSEAIEAIKRHCGMTKPKKRNYFIEFKFQTTDNQISEINDITITRHYLDYF